MSQMSPDPNLNATQDRMHHHYTSYTFKYMYPGMQNAHQAIADLRSCTLKGDELDALILTCVLSATANSSHVSNEEMSVLIQYLGAVIALDPSYDFTYDEYESFISRKGAWAWVERHWGTKA